VKILDPIPDEVIPSPKATEEDDDDSSEEEKDKTTEKPPQKKKSLKRFRATATGCSGQVFIEFDDPRISPTKFVNQILTDPKLAEHKW
jgi:hypothetical protein